MPNWIRSVAWNFGNQRRYSEADVEWVAFLLRLRETGMSIAKMREYATLLAQGSVTTESRLRLLEAHQLSLREQIARLHAHEKTLAEKIESYRDDLTAFQAQLEIGSDDE